MATLKNSWVNGEQYTASAANDVATQVNTNTEAIAAIDPGDVAADTHAAASKATPVDADELPLIDSGDSNGLKKLTWANLKAAVAGPGVHYLIWDGTDYVNSDGEERPDDDWPAIYVDPTGEADDPAGMDQENGDVLIRVGESGGGDVDVVAEIVAATLASVTPASGDEVLVRDASDSLALKVVPFSSFGGGGGSGDMVFTATPSMTPSGGEAGWGLPGMVFIATSTATLASGTDTYYPFYVANPDGITVTAIGLNKTTAPSAGTLRWAIYEATAAGQPHASHAPIYASSSLTVTAATGSLIESGLSVNLDQGWYLLAVNPSTAVVARSGQTAAINLPDDLSNLVVRGGTVTRAHAAFPTPGTPWATLLSNSPGVFLKWTEN